MIFFQNNYKRRKLSQKLIFIIKKSGLVQQKERVETPEAENSLISLDSLKTNNEYRHRKRKTKSK